MYVKLIRVDDQCSFNVSVSKITSVSELRRKVQNLTSVKPENQRLIHLGKQLEDWYILDDYDVNHEDVLHLMIKSNTVQTESSFNCGVTVSLHRPKEYFASTVCKYFKIGDYVDVMDIDGAWYEARIVKISRKMMEFCSVPCNKTIKQETAEVGEEGTTSTQQRKVSNSNKETTVLINAQNKVLYAGDPVYKLVIEHKGNRTFMEASLQDIRPAARYKLTLSDLKIGDKVFVNYNFDEPWKIGYWYEFCVTECKMKKGGRGELKGTLLLGREKQPLPNIKIWHLNEIFKVEKSCLLNDRSLADEELMKMPVNRQCKGINHCIFCNGNSKKNCKECSCSVCGEKKDPEKQILCDECNKVYHLTCLSPPLDQVPDFEWYCSECKTVNKIVKPGENLKPTWKTRVMPSKPFWRKYAWGYGMACVGRSKECTLVPSNHYGPIPGVEVGQTWNYRIQLSEAGVHRPPVAGIHGRQKDGAYSVILSGGYQDDLDNGDEFWYTGSGGRDFSGNKRTAGQSSDQKLTRMNKALALNCDAELNEKGATAKNWKTGKPVRVVRSHKLGKHSKYAPAFGNRYDGIYRVVEYLPEKGSSGFIIWRFLLRRDDPNPAPWTLEGKKRIENLGLQISVGPNGCEMEDQKESTFNKSKKRRLSTQDVPASSYQKKPKMETHSLSGVEVKLMKSDKLNKSRWEECCQTLQEGKQKFLSVVQAAFKCFICLELARSPVTLPCKHNICLPCLNDARSAAVPFCPCCRAFFGGDFVAHVNKTLEDLLETMFPDYAYLF